MMTFREWFDEYNKTRHNLHLDIEDMEAAWKEGNSVGYNDGFMAVAIELNAKPTLEEK